MARRFGGRVLVRVLLLVVVAQQAESSDNPGPSPTLGPLDGMHFVGDFGPEGGPGDLKEALYFDDGKFWSKNCIPCGFPPKPYWVRFVDDDIHFHGTLESSERGRFRYEGVISGKQLSVRINWRRERWYWTIDRDFWFEGTLAEAGIPVSANQAANMASLTDPQPPVDCNPGR